MKPFIAISSLYSHGFPKKTAKPTFACSPKPNSQLEQVDAARTLPDRVVSMQRVQGAGFQGLGSCGRSNFCIVTGCHEG